MAPIYKINFRLAKIVAESEVDYQQHQPKEQHQQKEQQQPDSTTEDAIMDMSPICKSEIDRFLFKVDANNNAEKSTHSCCSASSFSSSDPEQTTAQGTPSNRRRRATKGRKSPTCGLRLLPGSDAHAAALRDIDFTDHHASTVRLADILMDAKLIAALFLGAPPKMPQRLASLRVTSGQQDTVADIVACVMKHGRCTKREVYEALLAHSLATRKRLQLEASAKRAEMATDETTTGTIVG